MIAIINHFGYYICDNGDVISQKRKKHKTLKAYPNRDGYFYVDLHGKPSYIHRLVAIHFIDNPNNYNIVNHIDGNKANNHVSNLEWTTQKDNVNHAYKLGLMDKSIKAKIDKTIQFFRNNGINVLSYKNINGRAILESICTSCGTIFSARSDTFIRNSFSSKCNKYSFNHLNKPVFQYSMDDCFVCEFSSIREASRNTGIARNGISKCLSFNAISAGGFKWKNQKEMA